MTACKAIYRVGGDLGMLSRLKACLKIVNSGLQSTSPHVFVDQSSLAACTKLRKGPFVGR